MDWIFEMYPQYRINSNSFYRTRNS
jgi:hypothetical protein